MLSKVEKRRATVLCWDKDNMSKNCVEEKLRKVARASVLCWESGERRDELLFVAAAAAGELSRHRFSNS